MVLPCLISEDEHLLAVNKPAGMNTHAPCPYAGEGIYEWLRHREPRWARLAIIHRLDKETSGVIVFSRTELANRSLTGQFTQSTVRKRYLLMTDRAVRRKALTVRSAVVRVGERYAVRPVHAGAEAAETRFRVIDSDGDRTVLEAEPVTGKTHQIRVHAAANGFPILGDTLYGGTAAGRVHLHAEQVTLRHPATGLETTITAPADFSADALLALRLALVDPEDTNAYRLIHGASDGWPGWYVDRLGDFLVSQSEGDLNDAQRRKLAEWLEAFGLQGAFHKILDRQVRKTSIAQASPRPVLGAAAPEEFLVRENGLRFTVSFREGYSVGLFLDQRENRRRLLTGYVAPAFLLRGGAKDNPPPIPPREGSVLSIPDERLRSWEGSGLGSCLSVPSRPLAGMEILNTFAYTCGFSTCAARAGARATSLDLSRKYLEWGKRNFEMNGLDPAEHEFIYGDVFDWVRRFAKKGREFDLVVLDPPTFSQSKGQGVFQAGKDYARLVKSAMALLKPDGVLFASTNAGQLAPEKFVSDLTAAIQSTSSKLVQQQFLPQPPDFPTSAAEPAYLKTMWMRIGRGAGAR